MKSLAKNGSFNLIYTLLNLLFPLVTSIYVSRVLMSDGVGRVVYAQTIASYFVSLAALGLQNYGVREIAKVRNNSTEKNRLFTQLLIFNFITTTISLFLYTLLVMNVASMRAELPLFIACGLAIFWNYFNVDWFYQGEEEYVFIVCRSLFIKAASLIALFVFVKAKADYIAYAWIASFAIGGNYVFNIIHIRKYIRLSFADFKLKPHFKPILIFGVGTLIASIYAKIDITMLGTMSAEANVGYYSYGHKVIELILCVTTAITYVYLPRLCLLYCDNQQEFTRLLEQGIRILAFITFPIAAGLFIIAPQVVTLLFGKAFLPSAMSIRIFAVLVIIRGFGDLICYQLGICTGQEKLRLPAALLASVTNVILNLILIPYMAEIGAAIASVISEVIVNGYQLLKLRKIVSIPMPKDAFIDALVSTAVMSVLVVVISRLISNFVISLLISVSFGILVYLLINLVMKNKLEMMILNNVKERFVSRKR